MSTRLNAVPTTVTRVLTSSALLICPPEKMIRYADRSSPGESATGSPTTLRVAGGPTARTSASSSVTGSEVSGGTR